MQIAAIAMSAMIHSKPGAFVVAGKGTVRAAPDEETLGFAPGNAVVDSRDTW